MAVPPRRPHDGKGIREGARSLSPQAPQEDGAAAAVAVTILEPVLPGAPSEASRLWATLSDHGEQALRIEAWPALRLPFAVERRTVLSLELFEGSVEEGPRLLHRLEVPAGPLIFQRGDQQQAQLQQQQQRWCALSGADSDLSVGDRGGRSDLEGCLQAFRAAERKAAAEVCPKVFIALWRLPEGEVEASGVFSPSSSLCTPRGPDIRIPGVSHWQQQQHQHQQRHQQQHQQHQQQQQQQHQQQQHQVLQLPLGAIQHAGEAQQHPLEAQQSSPESQQSPTEAESREAALCSELHAMQRQLDELRARECQGTKLQAEVQSLRQELGLCLLGQEEAAAASSRQIASLEAEINCSLQESKQRAVEYYNGREAPCPWPDSIQLRNQLYQEQLLPQVPRRLSSGGCTARRVQSGPGGLSLAAAPPRQQTPSSRGASPPTMAVGRRPSYYWRSTFAGSVSALAGAPAPAPAPAPAAAATPQLSPPCQGRAARPSSASARQQQPVPQKFVPVGLMGRPGPPFTSPLVSPLPPPEHLRASRAGVHPAMQMYRQQAAGCPRTTGLPGVGV